MQVNKTFFSTKKPGAFIRAWVLIRINVVPEIDALVCLCFSNSPPSVTAMLCRSRDSNGNSGIVLSVPFYEPVKKKKNRSKISHFDSRCTYIDAN